VIVIPPIAMKTLMTQIVEATHSLCDEVGEPRVMSTIMESQLRMAALVALQVATGDAIWPGDRKIVIRQPKQAYGIFEEAD
jgi:hypothetical protein